MRCIHSGHNAAVVYLFSAFLTLAANVPELGKYKAKGPSVEVESILGKYRSTV